MPTIRQLETFRAVMMTRSMTDAARMLSVTQSAVSKIMKELQADVGFSLFIRRQGGLEPSIEAIALYAEVSRVFIGVERVERAAGQIRQRRFGQLRIVAMSSLTSYFIGGVVRVFKARHPHVSVSIETYNSPEVVSLVEGRYGDLGYAVTPVASDAVTVHRLFRTALVCILPRGHRMSKKASIRLPDLADENFVSVLNWNNTRVAIDAAFRSANVGRKLDLDAGWSATVSALVAEGLGVAIIDPFTAKLSAQCGCEVKPLKEPIEFCFAEIRPKAAPSNELAEAFSRTLIEAFDSYAVQDGATRNTRV